MAKSTFRYDDVDGMKKILNSDGSVAGIVRDGEKNKLFAVIAMCGHCGSGYAVPIVFHIQAKDMESAVALVQEMPRVKKGSKDVILGAKEVSEAEYWLIKHLNDIDPYMNNEPYDNAEKRRIVMRTTLTSKFVLKEDECFELAEKNNIELRFADSFLDRRSVLQRYFAPQLQGSDVVFSRSVEMSKLLKEYYEENVTYLVESLKDEKGNVRNIGGTALSNSLSGLLSDYLKVFGPDNKLGLGLKQSKSTPDKFYFTRNGELLQYRINKEICNPRINSEVYEKIKTCKNIFPNEGNRIFESIDEVVEGLKKIVENEKDKGEKLGRLMDIYKLYKETGMLDNLSKKEVFKLMEKETLTDYYKNGSVAKVPSRAEKFNQKYEKQKSL